jgi:hypothetical protein
MRCGTTSTETKFTALALMYGPPESWWRDDAADRAGGAIPLRFRIELEKLFDAESVARVGLRRYAFHYAFWYWFSQHEDHKRSST